MDSCSTRYPSIRSMNVSELLRYFRTPIGREALNALEEREADWSRDRDTLRLQCRKLDVDYGELLNKNQFLEEELNKRTYMQTKLEGDIQCLKGDIQCLEEKEGWSYLRIRALEAEASNLKRVHNEELARVRNEKADLEAKLLEFERQLALKHVKSEESSGGQIDRVMSDKTRAKMQRRRRKIPELYQRIQVLEREKKELQAEVCDAKREKNDEIQMNSNTKKVQELNQTIEALQKDKLEIEAELQMILNEKMALEAQNRRIEEEMKEKTSELANKLCQALNEKVALGRVEAELKDKISKLVNKIGVLEKGKIDQQSQYSKNKKERNNLIKKITWEKKTLEDEKRKVQEESDEKISELVKRTEVLVRERGDMEAELCKAKKHQINDSDRISKLKEALEDQKSQMEEAERHVSEILKTMGVLEREKQAMDAKNKEQCEEIKRISQERMDQKGRMEETDKYVSELRKTIEVLEREKEAMNAKDKEQSEAIKRILQDKTDQKGRMEEAEKHVSELLKTIEVLEREKEAMDAKHKEKGEEIKRILQEKMDQKSRMQEAEKRISKLLKTIGVLKREKEAMDAKDKEKGEEIKRILKGKTDQKSRMEEAEKRASELLKTIGVLEREKEAMDAKDKEKSEEIKRILKGKMDLGAEKRTADDKHKKVVLELFQIIEALKREKMELGAKFCEANKVNSEEMKRILKEKMDLEAEMRTLKAEDKKKILELFHMIEVLKREKMETETEFDEAREVQNEEMKRILNENMAMKAEKKASEEDGKKISEFADRVGILEKEKRGLEEEIMQKDEVIQVLSQENESLEDMKKKLKMEIDGLALKLKKDVELVQPVLRTPLQNEGENSLGGCKRKRTNADACKRKRHLSQVSDNLGSCHGRKPRIWEADQDLLDAFDGDSELCLEAICALYRQHKSSLGFKPDYSSKGIALAEYLIDEDPEVRMNKSVAELEQLLPEAVSECIDIAKQHYKQVFEIYKNKDDPLFLS